MSSQTRTATRKSIVRALALVFALIGCGAPYDLFYPRTRQMREFDPDEVARRFGCPTNFSFVDLLASQLETTN